ARRADRAVQRDRPPLSHRGRRRHRWCHPVAEHLGRYRGTDRSSHRGPSLPLRPEHDGRGRDLWGQVRRNGLFKSVGPMPVSPDIFKAYDVRGLYPSELDEDTARQIGRAFVAYLGASRIAVSRDMRVSSPGLAAAFIDGVLMQGADVVDYGLAATDMLYFAVVRDRLEGGAQITASHNPKQYNGVKMVRAEAFPLSGDAGIGEIREMIMSGSIPAP